MATLIPLVIGLFASSVHADFPKDVERQWKIRAERARARVQELAKKAASGATLSPREKCEDTLEKSFAAYASPGILKTLVERKGGEIRYAVVLLSDSTLTRLVYVYKETKTVPQGLVVQELAPGWTLTALAEGSQTITLTDTRGCAFRFVPADPLSAQ